MNDNLLVQYNTGTPPCPGVYACRVDHRQLPGLYADLFLMWCSDGRGNVLNRWGYLGSDQLFRGPVYGWVGPLARKPPA